MSNRIAAIIATLALAACAGASSTPSVTQPSPSAQRRLPRPAYIKHVIVMIQENRSFNDLFATFPGADGATTGKMKTPSGDQSVQLRVANLAEPCDFGHGYKPFILDYDKGAMDGFSLENAGKKCHGYAGQRPYQYVKIWQIGPYWDIAKSYVLADHMFQTQGSNSYTAHQDLIRGNTTIDANNDVSLVDTPTAVPWGCDASSGTVTSLLRRTGWSSLKYELDAGPFPCTNHFPSLGNYKTLRDLLDAKGVSWRYYTPAVNPPNTGAWWNAFDTIAAVRFGPQWRTNVTNAIPYEKQIFRDIRNHRLPAVSWVIPDDANSDHPGPPADTGPAWVATVINAVGASSYWRTTAVVVVWDDWGGFYDPVPPPFFDNWGGLGFRVPMLVVSAYAREGTGGGYVSHTQYEFGSILKFIEDNWSLGSLRTTDARANSIVDCFDFTQSPRAFKRIPTKQPESFFEHQPESFQPVDSE